MTNDEIIAALGTDYRFTSARNGNLKIDLAGLRKGNDKKPTPTEQVYLLYRAHKALTEKGVEVEIYLQSRTQDGNYAAWPHLWVNRQVATADEAAELRKEIAALKAQLTGENEVEEKPF